MLLQSENSLAGLFVVHQWTRSNGTAHVSNYRYSLHLYANKVIENEIPCLFLIYLDEVSDDACLRVLFL